MYQPTGDRVFVQFDSATVDVKVLPSGHKIYLPSAKGRVEQFATVVGVVHSEGVRGKLGLVKGDIVACSYQIVSNYELRNDGVTVYRNYYRLPDDSRVWKAEATQIMAVKRDGVWKSLGDWVLMTEIKSRVSVPIIGTTHVADGTDSVEEELAIGAILPTVKHPGQGRTLDGRIAYFDNGYRSEYEIEGTTYIILPNRLIAAYK